MSDKTDCLLLGYSGLDRRAKEYKELLKKYPEVENIPNALNAAITYLGTALDNHNLSFDFVNSIEDDFDLALEKVKSKKYYSVAITTTICPNIAELIRVVRAIKNIDQDIPVIVGGALVEYLLKCLQREGQFHEAFKELPADYIVSTVYGEDILATLIHHLQNGEPVEQIPNVYIRKGDQFVCQTTEEETYDLEENKVNWNLFKGKTGGAVILRTTLSCCFDCSFCTFKLRAGKFRMRSVESIEEELNQIESLGEVKLIHFIDDTLNVPTGRFKKFLKILVNNRYTFKWHSFLRCKNLDEETVQLMAESGCIGVFLGIESGNNDVLKVMKKQATVDDYKKGMALLQKYNIAIVASFFVGYPGETIQSAKDTYRFIEETRPTFYYIVAWYYDVFTPITSQKEKYQLKGLFHDWEHKDMNFETANKLVVQMKAGIKNSTLLEVVCYPFLFQIVSQDMDVESSIKNLKFSHMN